MHNGNWNNGMDGGNWWWIPMMIMMVAFWGGLIWIGVSLIRRTHPAPLLHAAGITPAAAATGAKPTAQEILAERLARGEIEADDYRSRLEALRGGTTT
ncbi:MAG: hypothetical protein Q7V57_07905 [Actinomycetota bacterium]|nr:hypothetical protein [Actinomycetota bacterium]